MPSSPKGLIVVGLSIFFLGLVLFLVRPSAAAKPPALAERVQKAAAGIREVDPLVATLADPWFRRPVEVPAPPAPSPKLPQAPVDSTSIIFLGSSKDVGGASTYFFKNSHSGQVLLLRPGETYKGWTLKEVGDRTFTIRGPGGDYESTR